MNKNDILLDRVQSERNNVNMDVDISKEEKNIEISKSVCITDTSDTTTCKTEKDGATMELDVFKSDEKKIVLSASEIVDESKDASYTVSSKVHNEKVCPSAELDISKDEKLMNKITGSRSGSGIEGSKYYAVSLPRLPSECDEVEPMVFTSKLDALAAIKKYPGARFMQFSSYDDAVEYSVKPLPSYTSQASLEEKPSKYKSVSSQQMVALRKTIEKGDESSFLDTVWSNPRYLINNAGDGPTVMQEGTRYNALHVAARFKQSEMCLSVLNTIQDPQFMSLLYPFEDEPVIEKRIERLIDLYLNTPDKSLSETPLHFACKFGAHEILSILLSYSQCDTNKRNKYGVLPREMICDRTSHSPNLKQKMDLMFEDPFYVPVLRDLENNILEPVIGRPCSANILLASTSSELTFGDNNLVYCAFAGPMSESAANNFYTLLKKRKFTEKLSFTPEEKKQLVDICLSDSEKGLERVGRKLAKELEVGWIEFWPTLQFWGDLSNEGLQFLEKKLRSHSKTEHHVNNSSVMMGRCEKLAKDVTELVDNFVQKFPDIIHKKDKLTFFVLFQSLLPHVLCMTKFSFSKGKELHLIHKEIGHQLYMKLKAVSSERFEDLKFYLNKQFHSLDSLLKSHTNENWKMLICILKCLCYYPFCGVKNLKPPNCNCNWNIQRKFYYSSYFAYKFVSNEGKNLKEQIFNASMNNNNITANETSPLPAEPKTSAILIPFQNLTLDIQEISGDKFLVDQQKSPTSSSPEVIIDDIFYSFNDSANTMPVIENITMSDEHEYHEAATDFRNEDSPMKGANDDFDDFYTPPESPSADTPELFVNGVDNFSDVDIDIFRAIVDGGASIHVNQYPYVCEWKRVMESKLRSLLKPRDKLSVTPASSSASVRRAVMPVERVRRTLF